MKGKKKCQYCGKMFKLKGLRAHERFCRSKPRNETLAMEPEKPTVTSYQLQMAEMSAFNRGRESYKKEIEQSTRKNDALVKALESASKAVDAIAHMVSDIS